MVIKFNGDWEILKDINNMHFVEFELPEVKKYYEKMTYVHKEVMKALKYAQENGIDYVMFIHGYSAAKPFIMTPRSIVRSIMNSKEALPFIIKGRSIQHESVFVAAIKPKNSNISINSDTMSLT